MFIAQGISNKKYLLIVAIFAIIAFGGLLLYSEVISIEFLKEEKLQTPEKSAFEEITKIPTIAGFVNNSILSEAEEIYVSGQYAYITGGGGALTIVDVSNPQKPIIAASINDIGSIEKNGFFVSGKYAYALIKENFATGNIFSLTIIDISNSISPAIVGSINIQELGGSEFQGIYVLDNYAYIVLKTGILKIIDVSNPVAPITVGSLSLSDSKGLSWPYKIFVSGQYAYIASWGFEAKTLIVNVSDPTEPKLVKEVDGPKFANDIYVMDKHAYITGAEDALTIIDFSDSVNPEKIGLIKDLQIGTSFGVYVSGKYAYVSGALGLAIIDVSVPGKPEIVTTISDRKLEGAKDIYVSERYVYLPASNANNLVIIDLKGETAFTPKSVSVLSEKTIELKEEFIEKNEREIAFLCKGDIWLLSKNLKEKFKLCDTKEDITFFSFSPDGEEVYWLNNKGEIWKRKDPEEQVVLLSVEQDMEEAIQETWGLSEPFSYLRGKALDLWVSPDGDHIAYSALETHTSCCMAPPTAPVASLRIMKNDGTEKVEIKKPVGIRSSLLRIDGWIPNSNNIIFHFTDPDAGTGYSSFFTVDPEEQDPKLYTEIFKFFKQNIKVQPEDLTSEDIDKILLMVGNEPVYSPTGEKVAYIENWEWIRLKTAGTEEVKTILELSEENSLPFGLASRILLWSKDGELLIIKGRDKILVFNKGGELIFETGFDAEIIESVIISPDNKTLGGVYTATGERIKIIFFIDLTTKEKKEFKLLESRDHFGTANIRPQLFSESDRFYYLKENQLWAIDINTWENYKVTDDIQGAAIVPL